ncbi:MAG: CHAT domain-containing protein [Chitinophagales bacterium]
MFRLALLFFLVFFLVFASSQDLDTNKKSYLGEYEAIDKIFRKAGQIPFSSNYTDEMEEQELALNLEALNGFKKIIPAIEKAHDDSLAFYCHYKIGILEHYFDSLVPAKHHYETAINIQARQKSLADSLLFKPYLFIGGIQYNMNQFDSALFNYKKAEAIARKYQVTLDGTNRLYNTLGAMYYETGNYSQAKNYFEKAIALLGTINSSNEGLLVNYRINLAATLTKLEDFDEANKIYQDLLKRDINKHDILHNLGTINLRLGAAQKALNYFMQVKYTSNKIVRLMNDIGQAYENIGLIDSARHYYVQAINENLKWNKNTRNVQAGLTLKYLGDLDNKQNESAKALEKYQQAIIQLVNDFNSPDIKKNPAQYSGAYSYINLFQLLTAKGNAFERLYGQEKDTKLLEASLDAYRSAFKLADYVERTYDSDEARLFLNKIKYIAHSKPIDIALLLFDLTGKKDFLEDAYFFDQRNKASILSLNLKQNELRNMSVDNNEVFQKESSLKSTITRLSLKAQQTTDSTLLQSINSTIRDHEIELGKLQEKINSEPAYRNKQATERIPLVKEIQKSLDSRTALLSYHLSENRLLILTVTAAKFKYHVTPTDQEFFLQINSFKTGLHAISEDHKYDASAIASSLYQKLIAPAGPGLSGINRLIIIPDDELNYLPFEALQNENGEYLIQRFSVQYQYSTALFEMGKHENSKTTTLAFAPFTNKGYSDSTGIAFSRLPASIDEVKELEGKIFTDSSATKQRFLQAADRYDVLHLATHASVNNESPLRSFIAFYPDKTAEDYKLYAGEIYNLDLDSTQLVILSACETGSGKLIRGEGLMSLSRAFAYAGCPNIITSLWKAEDKTTAFISRRIHFYLQRGQSKDKALQHAKLDLLNSNEIDPRFKTPNYWAQMIFIGQYETNKSAGSWWWAAVAVLIATIALMFLRRNRS